MTAWTIFLFFLMFRLDGYWRGTPLAWNAREIRSNRNGRHGYTLYKWCVCTKEQLADRYGPGKVRQLETCTPGEEELLREWEDANETEARRVFNSKLSKLSTIEFIV